MPEHEALLTDEERMGAHTKDGTLGVLLAQHNKTLAWADARKVRCPCRRNAYTGWWGEMPPNSCGLCHGSGEVTVGDLVKEAGA